MNFNEIFPDNREAGETKLRQCQLVMLRLLKILDFLCKKHEIDYFLMGGSLLGAVRHQGFIPWDDDLDVGMTSKNYEKFKKHAAPELPNDIFFQNTSTDPHYRQTDFVDARLRDKYSSYTHLDGTINPWHEGLQLDIFVCNKVYFPNKFLIIIQNMFLNIIWKNADKRFAIIKKLENILPFPTVYANNWLQSPGMIKLGANFLRQGEIKTLVKMKFEDMEASVPIGYDTCLSRQFGDYMKMPPEDKRISHHNVDANPIQPCNHREILDWNNS